MPKYNDYILNYYNDNSHVGSFNSTNKNIGTGLVGSPSCGDVMKLQIKVKKNKNEKSGKIVDAKILVFGCGSAKASSSYVAKYLIGKTIEEALKIKNADIATTLNLPRIKLHCSVLAENAIQRAVKDYIEKNKKNTNTKKLDTQKENKNKKRKDDKIEIFISKEAINFIKKYLSKTKKNTIGIRLCLEGGKCGLMYKTYCVKNNENTENYIVKNIDGINFFIKHDEIKILNGTKIDFKEEGLKRGLIFKNPKETGKCNCGLSFFTKKY